MLINMPVRKPCKKCGQLPLVKIFHDRDINSSYDDSCYFITLMCKKRCSTIVKNKKDMTQHKFFFNGLQIDDFADFVETVKYATKVWNASNK